VELEKYDRPNFYDSYTRALEETKTRTNDVIQNISGLIGSIAAAIYTLLIILSIDPYVLIFSLIPLFNMFYLGKKRNRLYYDPDKETTYHHHRADYVKRVFEDYECKEGDAAFS
jgi:ATP-binding cassette subfamily B protein